MIERQMDLLKAEVIRMARQTTVQGDGLTDLRSRTVRDKYPHTPKENLAVTMPKVF